MKMKVLTIDSDICMDYRGRSKIKVGIVVEVLSAIPCEWRWKHEIQ